jgi:hypothetical protein
MTFPLDWKIFKPRGTLAEHDCYQTKIELAREIISELVKLGFNINLVLADSLYGESSSFIEVLEKHNLSYNVTFCLPLSSGQHSSAIVISSTFDRRLSPLQVLTTSRSMLISFKN